MTLEARVKVLSRYMHKKWVHRLVVGIRMDEEQDLSFTTEIAAEELALIVARKRVELKGEVYDEYVETEAGDDTDVCVRDIVFEGGSVRVRLVRHTSMMAQSSSLEGSFARVPIVVPVQDSGALRRLLSSPHGTLVEVGLANGYSTLVWEDRL